MHLLYLPAITAYASCYRARTSTHSRCALPASRCGARCCAHAMIDVFEKDLKRATVYTFDMWRARPWRERVLEALLQPIKSQL